MRALGVAIAIAALWWSSSSFGVGLGLGEVNVVSSLSAPLKASITLRGMDAIDLDPDQFSIRIDGESAANIDYRLERVDADTALIHLYTREAISEPVIQFRVEVSWDRSAVARSYDAFIDPPAYQQYFNRVDASAEDLSSAAGQTREEALLPVAQLPPIALGDPAASTTRADAAPLSEETIEEPVNGEPDIEVSELRREYGPTIDGNSIWRVARAVSTDAPDLTIYQWMYAIWQANPHAFMGANMHRLNMGVVLAIPLDDEVRERPHAEAWRAYSSQMALLQPAEPVSSEPARLAEVAVERRAQAQSAEASSAQLTDAPVDKPAQFAEPATDNPAVASPVDNSIAESLALTANEDALIALLEESAFAMDERAIVGANQAAAVQPALAETAVEVETAGNADTVIMPTAAIVETATNDTPAVLSAKPGEIILDDIEAADIGPVVAIDQADPGFAPMLATDQVVEQVGTSADAISKIPAADWYESLQSRHQFVESMPVIGTAGPLAFVGRALQRADAFVATSPSWATLVFGAWVTLLVVMLRNELVSRRRRLPVAAAGKPAVATGVTRAGPAAEVPPAPAVSEGPAGKTRSRHLPAQPPSESNARLIIAQADSILAGGDAEEAIKLMKLAVELQPNQSMLVNRLLELYHQTRRADDFARLLDDSLTVLENLDPGDIAKLQTMHSRLLAGIAFPLAHVQAAASETMLAKDPIDARHAEQALPANDEEIDELAKPGAAEEIDMPLFAASGTAVDDIAVDDDSDRRVMATGVSEDFSHRFDALAAAAESRHDDEDFVETQVIYTDDGVPLREEAVERQSVVGEILDLDVTLKEADVYLAYGLYESAEELLLKGLEVDPNRADFLARLLDAYYATRNLVDFVACAEVMLDMGEAGREHWEKVEIMGYELAPYNKMFAGGKDRSLSAVELGIPRPETADFDFSDIEADRLQAATDIAIDRDEEAEAMAADLNLDLATSDYEDTADKLDQILSLDTSDTPAIPAASRHFDDDDISSFVIDDDGHVDDSASEGGHFRSLLTSEILAIPETAENADHEDSLSFDPDSANELDDITTGDEQLRSLETSEILGIPETSTQADIEDDVVFEIDEDALAMDLDAVGEELELDLDGESAADDDDPDDADLDFADEEVMKFTIENTLDGLAASLDTGETSLSVVENPSAEAAANPGAEIADGRILYFPENNNEGRAISEFESEVKVTLQAIRDQLQHITERLFRQERETNELKQVIAELGKDDVAAGKKKNKKSS